MRTLKRYDLITNYRCGSSIEEMERNDEDGDWVRFEDVAPLLASETGAAAPLSRELAESLRSGLLFNNLDEPLDDYGKRIVRAISQRLEAAPSALQQHIDLLLRAIRPLDCGHHYCRYCDAGTKNQWQHSEYCLYQQSVQDVEAARRLLAALSPSAQQEPTK